MPVRLQFQTLVHRLSREPLFCCDILQKRPSPTVAIIAPVTEVVLSPILSERMPAKNERKNVDPMAKEPTNAKFQVYIIKIYLVFHPYHT